MYMYGGYGFWSFKNYTTYYDFSSNQWELFRTQSEIQPRSRWKPVYDLKNNKLYVLGGRSSLSRKLYDRCCFKRSFCD
jgi:hypothetical protein